MICIRSLFISQSVLSIIVNGGVHPYSAVTLTLWAWLSALECDPTEQIVDLHELMVCACPKPVACWPPVEVICLEPIGCVGWVHERIGELAARQLLCKFGHLLWGLRCIIVSAFDRLHINFVLNDANREAEYRLRGKQVLGHAPRGVPLWQEYLTPLHHLILLLVEHKQVLFVELPFLFLAHVERLGLSVQAEGMALIFHAVELVPDLMNWFLIVFH